MLGPLLTKCSCPESALVICFDSALAQLLTAAVTFNICNPTPKLRTNGILQG